MRAWLGNLAKGAGGGSASASASSSSRDQSQDPGGRPRDAPPQDQEGGGGGRLTRGGGDRPGIGTPSSQSSGPGRQESVFNLMGSGGRGSHAASAALDAEMERRVAIAARNLGDGVSRIVLAARMGGGASGGGASGAGASRPAEWKVRLLDLLGGDDARRDAEDADGPAADGDAPPVQSAQSDIDVLLANSSCERFVLRCVENELPPNLIHCLRLLRVLELQHDHAHAAATGPRGARPGPVSAAASSRVSRLLVLLCGDPSVGEQLRPHLFGLLALSGASYPASGAHIAGAAGEVIRSFGRSCLSPSLVWFLHDRKMVVHMTDDVKELCGLADAGGGGGGPSGGGNYGGGPGNNPGPGPGPGPNRCLYGADAEKAGLWVVALSTVVHLVAASCRHRCVELLRDYDSAGGYHVLAHAIANSSAGHVPPLLELVTVLVCCRIAGPGGTRTPGTGTEDRDGAPGGEDVGSGGGDGPGGDDYEAGPRDHDGPVDIAEGKMAMNTNAFEIVDELMARSTGVLAAYKSGHGGARPGFGGGSDVGELADFSVKYAWDTALASGGGGNSGPGGGGANTNTSTNANANTNTASPSDLTRELMVTILRLYSDHARNFDLIESEYHTLSHYILAFPTLEDAGNKVLALKTLEYVCTGLASGSSSATPLRVATEVFASLCRHLLRVAGGMDRMDAMDATDAAGRGEEREEDQGEEDAAAKKALESSELDLEMLCDTLVKLLEYDDRVAHQMLDCGLLGSKVDDVLDLVAVAVKGAGAGADAGAGASADELDPRSAASMDEDEADLLLVPAPAGSTRMDGVYACLCRILRVVVRRPGSRGVGERSSGPAAGQGAPCPAAESSLTTLLSVGVLRLGDGAARSALDVFKGMMAKAKGGDGDGDGLGGDMACLLGLVDKFSARDYRDCRDCGEGAANGGSRRKVDPLCLSRQVAVMDTIRSVLPGNEASQDAFRTRGGFETIVRLVVGVEGALGPASASADTADDAASTSLLESAFALLATATDPGGRNLKSQAAAQRSLGEGPSGDLLTPPFPMDISFGDTVACGTPSPSTANVSYLRDHGFYTEFAGAIAGTGILDDVPRARAVMNLALELIHPRLVLSPGGKRTNADKSPDARDIVLRNADAVRLVLGLATRLPSTDGHRGLAKNAFDELLRLCANDMAGSSLARLASSGLCTSLTSPSGFAPMLEDRSHFLYSRFVLLLRRIAAFSMSHNDFVSLLRCVAGPILAADQDDGSGGGDAPTAAAAAAGGRIRLAVITSSAKSRKPPAGPRAEAWQTRESGFCNRLETLSVIAERGDRVARCEVGGDSLNSIAMYMQSVPLEERMYRLAEQGRLRFLEVESVDASARAAAASAGGQAQASGRGADKADVWAPLVGTGFTFCAWMRQHHPVKDGSQASLFVFDISSPPVEEADGSGRARYGGGGSGHEFFSFWYDIPGQRFCVLSSSNSRGEPTCFPVSPLPAGVWHHIQLTYHAPKRGLLGRKATINLYIDGRPVESDARVEAFNLPPTARVHIGVPNPVLASSGIVRGSMPTWDLGPTQLVSSVLTLRDATAMYTAGPEFPGLFWGDRPQRLSLAAAATAAFVMLAENGEKGSVAGALRRRKVPSMEAVGHVMRERGFGGGPIAGPESDSLSAVGLLCKLSPESVVFGFRACSSSNGVRSQARNYARRLLNVSRINTNVAVSTDAVVYGYSSIISPNCFADNVQWIGGPNMLMPIINAAQSSSTMALSLRMIRESVRRHPPNLEMLQAGGGYRVLALLLRQKRIMDVSVLDQCFAFAVHGFVPGFQDKDSSKSKSGSKNESGPLSKVATHRWVFADLDAMKYLLLNHQVWDLNGAGPELPLRLLTYFNGLVVAHSTHAAFNSRRLHLLGIIRWTLHLMLEATELFAAGADGELFASKDDGSALDVNPSRRTAATAALKNGWFGKPMLVSRVASGSDPGNDMLLSCKTLLRRVLTFMLTPGDLEAIAGAAIYTVSITGGIPPDSDQVNAKMQQVRDAGQEKLAPGAVARVYLLRLLEELVVDGVNEIVTDDAKGADPEGQTEPSVEPHSGGGASSGSLGQKGRTGSRSSQQSARGDSTQHPKHQEAQIFLSAFAGILTPVWFACILEGCREEASASAVLRLMILMIQNSRKFAMSFEEAGGFAPLVLSIPKFSTCPSIILSMLSHLLHAPILHLPCFATLETKQLCDVFDAESDAAELITEAQRSRRAHSDPSCGIFALLAECLGRNIQLASFDNEMGRKARNTNEAVLQLLSHRHAFSPPFQQFCRTPDFLEPLAQALCLVHDERLQKMQSAAFGESDGGEDSGETNNLGDGDSTRSGGEYSVTSRTNSKDSADDDFVEWPSDDGKRVSGLARRGSLKVALHSETPTERFVGKADEDKGSGIGMVQLLHLVLSHAVLQGPLAAPLVSALFRSFPIHASPDQVEAFHLVLIEHCRSVVEDTLQRGEPIAIANCIGMSSVLLDRLMAGFFTSEPVLEAVNIAMLTLNSLTSSGTYASRTLANVDQNLLVADTAHIARLTCLTAIQRSRPMGAYDEGDDDLKLAVLSKIGEFMRQLLLVPSNLLGGQGTMRKQGGYPTPAPNSRFYPLWQSASLSRCCPPSVVCTYPDLTIVEEPDRAFVVSLMADIHSMLLDDRRDIREQAVVVVVSLLQRRRGIMSELLITDIPRGDHRMETVDLMNRGGFGALLVAHEATTIAENANSGNNSMPTKANMKYASFFEWLERNQEQVAAVFHGIHVQASRMALTTDVGAATPEEAIENEQKVMLLKLTSQDSSDRTILGGLERAELAQRSHDATAESHSLWKRQGFDDLSSGAMQWKFLLRQLKGSCSIWEGGSTVFDESCLFAKSALIASLLKKRPETENEEQDTATVSSNITVKRWKLDLTEGYERQRRRLLPNYEFHGLYNIDEKVDNVKYVDESGLHAIQDEDEAPESAGSVEDYAVRENSSAIITPEMEVTADLLKKMNLEKMHEDEDEEDEIMDDDFTGEDTVVLHTQAVCAEDESIQPAKSDDKKDSKAGQVENDSKETDVDKTTEGEEVDKSNVSASSYDLITGLLKAGDWPEKSYNISRCTGLEVRKALLLWCRNAIYVVDGFEQTDGEGLKGKIKRLKKATTSFQVNIRQHNSDHNDQPITDKSSNKAKDKTSQDSTEEEITYQHRSQRIAFTDLYSVYRRRYQLQQNALEFYDVNRNGTLIAFSSHDEREEVLSKVLSSPLPSSIFSSSALGGSGSINYKKFMNNLRAKITSQWTQGKMTNFDFIMHMNSFAGRTYNDLTQYPVFPWVLADYDSEEIDLNDPKVYRNFSKPMGAQNDSRVQQFRDRYEALEQSYEMGEGPPPFHYGTHYSCAAYVLYYLMRLEPFSRLALSLQGGKFDVADRLFHNIGSSWKSASSENLQDVRELIPEFFYLSDFVVNNNMFDFGTTQSGKTVHDVTLPAWAKGDPKRFIRIHRQVRCLLYHLFMNAHLKSYTNTPPEGSRERLCQQKPS